MRRLSGMAWKGYLIVRITSEDIENWLNKSVERGIELWDIRRLNDTSLLASISIKDYRHIRPFLKETGARASILKKNGLFFKGKRFLLRKGLIAGVLLALLLLFLLSNILFTIKINGADPVLELKINEALKKQHIHIGMFTPLMTDKIKLEKILSQQLKDVTWIGIAKKGTSLEIDVVQKSLPKKEKVIIPSNLVASKTGMVKSIFTKRGQAMVKRYQWVNKGDLLISGKIGTEKKPEWIAAEGKVMAETWYYSSIIIPNKRTVTAAKGLPKTEHSIVLFGHPIHLWGKTPDKKNSNVSCHEKTSSYYLLNLQLPVKTRINQCDEVKKVTFPVNDQDALKMAEKVSDQRLLEQTPEKTVISLRKLESVKKTSSGRTFSFRYVVEENIAVRDVPGAAFSNDPKDK